MIIITFRQSKSVRYKEVLRYCLFFENFTQGQEFNTLELSIRDIIEKWEWFNLLLWIVLDWKGTTVKHEGVTYHSHQDKTKIFYALQQIHTNWMNYTEEKLIQAYKVVPPKSQLLDVDPETLTDEQINQLIDVMMTKIQSRKRYEAEMKRIEGMIVGE